MDTISYTTGINIGEYVSSFLFSSKFRILFYIICVILYCYGAAKLSYNYNMSTNNGTFVYFWCTLCFIFSSIYYPYYAFFLNPVVPIAAVNIATGGRRH